jgi:cell division transport system permease protein
MRTWAAAHQRALAGALRRFAGAPLASLLNVAVIGIALALPMAFYVLLDNARNLARDYSPQPELSLFLAADAGTADIQVIELRLKKHAGLAGYRFVSKAQALEQLKSRASLGDVAAGLPQNPLPDAFVVTARDGGSAALEALRAEFAGWPKVAEAHVDSDWARRLDSLIALGRYAVLMLAGILAFALVAITFNTIRLQILTQRDEIEVAKLIGATDGWIQRPFLYYGALAGAAGGITAWLLTAAGLLVLNHQLKPLAALYGLPLQLGHLGWGDTVYAMAIAAGLGWFGAWLSVRRHLSQHNPS